MPALNAAITETAVSGISSGAFMAVQVGTAWSSIIKGVGAIAGGPFDCAQGSLAQAQSTCTGGAPPSDVAALIKQTDAWSHSGAIDDVNHIAGQKIYLFGGYNDTVVTRPVVNSLSAFYANYVGRTGNLFYQTAIGAGHSQVTLDFGGKCRETGGEFINKCGYDQAGIILQHIYGVLEPRTEGALTGQIISFNQAEFTAPDAPIDDSLDDSGFAFVPAACQAKEPCRLLVALHGCLQSSTFIQEDFVRHAGYNEWADRNHIVVVYPQTHPVAVTALGVTNPEACWDFWGYLDANPMASPTYLLKSGKQIRAVKAMIDRVTSGAIAQSPPATTNPAAPTTVLAADRSDTAIDVVWSEVPGAATYDLFRAGPGDTDPLPIATVAGLSYGDTGLQPATPYRYKVRASSADGLAPFSQIMSAATLAPVPPCDDPGNCALH